jgi:chemotaxis protein methyltransferase CheR
VKNSLAEIAELVRRETGIVLPPARQDALRGAVDRAAGRALDPGAFLRATADPVRGPGLVDRLIDEVTVQESSFVRSRRQFDEIDWPALLQGARTAGSAAVRVWSAGCASGEEAYTLALLAAEALGPAVAAVDVLGTDISGAALAAAQAGRYRERAVRGLEPALRGRYLTRQPDGTYLVGGRLRGLVRFRRHNLARDPIPPIGETRFDVIACRNVLIYLETPLVEPVTDSLRQSLRPGGVFLLGAADALQRRTRAPAPRPGQSAPSRSRRQAARPPGLGQPASREQWLATALGAADRGDRDAALAAVAALLAGNPLDADAHFIQGLVTLAAGDPAKAAAALRRALCIDPTFALAAFALGRSYDAAGDEPAARRAYEQALRTLDPADRRHELMLQQVDLGDVAAACRARLARP